jgi:hypothetical protein
MHSWHCGIVGALTPPTCIPLVYIHSFNQWLYSSLLGPGFFFSFVIIFTQTVGLLGRVICPSQGRYLHTGQHKHRINVQRDVHPLSGIRTHDPSVWAIEDSSYLRPRGHCDLSLVYMQSLDIPNEAQSRSYEPLEHLPQHVSPLVL